MSLIDREKLLEEVKHTRYHVETIRAITNAPTVDHPQVVKDVLDRIIKAIECDIANYSIAEEKYKNIEDDEGVNRCINKAMAARSCIETVRALKEVK